MGTTGSQALKNRVNELLESRLGYRIERAGKAQAGPPPSASSAKAPPKPKKKAPAAPADVDSSTVEIAKKVKSRTMTGTDKLYALVEATRYVSRHNIEGDIVECGVWRGGSMMAVAYALDEIGDTSRDLHLFDTYDGMSEPTEDDRRIKDGSDAKQLLDKSVKDEKTWVWAYASLEDVQAGMEETPYPTEKLHYIKGKVEDTVPEHAPEKISLLRLDTDWYESTKHELEHLYSRLSPGGVIIFDDYGYWEGARKAVDEFIERTGEKLLLIRIATGRIAVKTNA